MEVNTVIIPKEPIRLRNSEGRQIFFSRLANNEKEAVIEAYIKGIDLSDLESRVKVSDLDEELTKIMSDNIRVLFNNLCRRSKNESRNKK